MISLKNYIFIISIILIQQFLIFGFKIPKPKFELYEFNSGFRVSIPDENGTELFAFHGSINSKLKNYEPGDFSAIITKPSENGDWIYENNNIKLHKSDILYYWIYIQYDKNSYHLFNQHISINQFNIISIFNRNSIDFINNRFNNNYCKLSDTIFNGKPICTNILIFEELFNNNDINLTKWQHEIYIPNDLNDGEFVVYQGRKDNIYVFNGYLNIIPTLYEQIPGCNYDNIRKGILDLGINCTGILTETECKRNADYFRILPPIVSGKIRTKNSFSFRYGRIEVKAKLPKGDWIFPQIFLEPLDNYYGTTGFDSGQIRIAFIRGNEILYNNYNKSINGNRLFGGVILSNGENYREHWLLNNLWHNHFGEDFHIYSLIWTNVSLTFEVDGIVYGIIDGGFNNYMAKENFKKSNKLKTGSFMAPFDKEFFISLGVSVGGISDFPDNCKNGIDLEEKPWQNYDPKGELNFWRKRKNWLKTWKCQDTRMLVDYVKVWSL